MNEKQAQFIATIETDTLAFLMHDLTSKVINQYRAYTYVRFEFASNDSQEFLIDQRGLEVFPVTDSTVGLSLGERMIIATLEK